MGVAPATQETEVSGLYESSSSAPASAAQSDSISEEDAILIANEH